MATDKTTRAPIFVHGILGRSGTNYLTEMLALHPACAVSPIPEDWLLAKSEWLTCYVDAVSKIWRHDPAWEIDADAEDALLRHLGAGLISFLARQAEAKRLISKTPDVNELGNFFRLFPDAYLLVLVRDGRSVVESYIRSFGGDANKIAGRWARAAGQILDFDRAHGDSTSNYRLIRYEDLVRDPINEMAALLRFLDLDAQDYDFSAIRRLPVFGSSTSRDASGNWEWTEVPDTGDLGSLERWSGWSRDQHEQFNRIAGDRLEQLGYRPLHFPDPAGP